MATEPDGAHAAIIGLIEDDPSVANVVIEALTQAGYRVHHESTIDGGRRMLIRPALAALILDLSLPDGSGLELSAAARQAGIETPILMLTARGTVQERVQGFQQGADDYLCKPFDVAELVARVNAIIRRSSARDRHVLTYADVHLNLLQHTVTRGPLHATLSAREIELLAFLIKNPERVLPRDEILERVWGDEADADSNVLNVYVNYLRNKIEASRYPRIIHTVRGRGYMLSTREPELIDKKANDRR